ncbi:hypothetical protein EJB05_53643, partial [Eragrostis curvula]
MVAEVQPQRSPERSGWQPRSIAEGWSLGPVYSFTQGLRFWRDGPDCVDEPHIDEPHIVCFLVSERYFVDEGDRTEWFVMLDLRSKTILSACRRSNKGGYGYGYGKNIFPSRISDYFNPCPSNGSSNCFSSLKSENQIDMVAPPVEKLRGNNDVSICQSSKMADDAAMQASEKARTML